MGCREIKITNHKPPPPPTQQNPRLLEVFQEGERHEREEEGLLITRWSQAVVKVGWLRVLSTLQCVSLLRRFQVDGNVKHSSPEMVCYREDSLWYTGEDRVPGIIWIQYRSFSLKNFKMAQASF